MKKITDFRNFLYKVWKFLGLPNPTGVQYDMAKFLEEGDQRCMIQAFRGVGKTYILAAYALFCLYRDPTLKIGIISKSSAHATEVTRHCFKILCSMPELAHLKPDIKSRQSATAFDVNGCDPSPTPSLYGMGITSQVTGKRADILIVDDIETASNSATVTQREQLEKLASEFAYVCKKGGRIIYLGTPHTEDSIYRKLPNKGYSVRLWPFEVPKDRSFYLGRITEFVEEQIENNPPGHIIESERWDDRERLLRLSEGPSIYRMQNMLNTDLSDLDKYPLKLSDLIVMDVDPDIAPEKIVWSRDASVSYNDDELASVGLTGDRFQKPWQVLGSWEKYDGSVMSIDPSGRGKCFI